MAHATISQWTATEWTDGLEAAARDKFVPMIMANGAMRVNMIRTGGLSFTVVTEYPDAATASTAQTRIAEIRAQAAEELPLKMDSAADGGVFANG